MPLRKIKKLSLYKALKLGYLRNERKQKNRLKRFGYRLDEELTNNERMVAYNPINNKLLFVENGSEANILKPAQFLEDWHNNFTVVPAGAFDYTPRFQDAKSAYLKAKKKYEKAQFEMVGHSQAAITVNDLAKGNDKGITFNGALIKQKDNPNVTNYRTKNDLVSSLSNPNDMRTLATSSSNQNPITAHNISNIQFLPVFL